VPPKKIELNKGAIGPFFGCVKFRNRAIVFDQIFTKKLAQEQKAPSWIFFI
jgi:hypothetical protein